MNLTWFTVSSPTPTTNSVNVGLRQNVEDAQAGVYWDPKERDDQKKTDFTTRYFSELFQVNEYLVENYGPNYSSIDYTVAFDPYHPNAVFMFVTEIQLAFHLTLEQRFEVREIYLTSPNLKSVEEYYNSQNITTIPLGDFEFTLIFTESAAEGQITNGQLIDTLITLTLYEIGARIKLMADDRYDLSDPNSAYTLTSGAGTTNPQDIKPPGWNENWEWRYGTRGDTPRWFDPNGGEWRLHTPDPWHDTTHWDYNPWTDWSSPWQNLPFGGD